MKPTFYLQRLILICSAVAATAALSACGQIGPLYMPRIPADPDAPPGSAAAEPMPPIIQQQQQRMPLPGSNGSSTQSIYTTNPGSR